MKYIIMLFCGLFLYSLPTSALLSPLAGQLQFVVFYCVKSFLQATQSYFQHITFSTHQRVVATSIYIFFMFYA